MMNIEQFRKEFYRNGVFYKLSNLPKGSEIAVETINGNFVMASITDNFWEHLQVLKKQINNNGSI